MRDRRDGEGTERGMVLKKFVQGLPSTAWRHWTELSCVPGFSQVNPLISSALMLTCPSLLVLPRLWISK